jgi:hypothetical protein
LPGVGNRAMVAVPSRWGHPARVLLLSRRLGVQNGGARKGLATSGGGLGRRRHREQHASEHRQDRCGPSRARSPPIRVLLRALPPLRSQAEHPERQAKLPADSYHCEVFTSPLEELGPLPEPRRHLRIRGPRCARRGLIPTRAGSFSERDGYGLSDNLGCQPRLRSRTIRRMAVPES